MTRTRTISDEQILDAAVSFVSQYGAEKLTFMSLGSYVGLAPSTLVQRFGTKRQLLAAATMRCLQDMNATLEAAKGRHSSRVDAILDAFTTMTTVVTSVEEYANGQIFFYLSLTEPEVYAKLRASMQDFQKKVKELLDEAVTAQELQACDTAQMALLLQTTYEGAIITWIVYQQGDVEQWVAGRLRAVLRPYAPIVPAHHIST